MTCPSGANFGNCDKKCKCCDKSHPCYNQMYSCGNPCPPNYVLTQNGCSCTPECNLLDTYQMVVTLHSTGYNWCRWRLQTFPPYDPIYECGTAGPTMSGPYTWEQKGNQVNVQIQQPIIVGCGDIEGCEINPPPSIKLMQGECNQGGLIAEHIDTRCVPCKDTLNGGPTLYYTIVSATKVDP